MTPERGAAMPDDVTCHGPSSTGQILPVRPAAGSLTSPARHKSPDADRVATDEEIVEWCESQQVPRHCIGWDSWIECILNRLTAETARADHEKTLKEFSIESYERLGWGHVAAIEQIREAKTLLRWIADLISSGEGMKTEVSHDNIEKACRSYLGISSHPGGPR